MADCTALRDKLSEAEEALHRISTGGYVEELVSPNGTRIRYGAGDASKLAAYIQLLQGQLAACESAGVTVRRPIYFTF